MNNLYKVKAVGVKAETFLIPPKLTKEKALRAVQNRRNN